MTLRGRELVLGVGGGISAYKSAELLRRLQDLGFAVTVIPTRASLNFVGSATWEALSGRRAISELWGSVHEVPHIKLANEADLIVIAPATADLIAKIATGRADDLLTNIVSATTAPMVLIPAMHSEMWLNPATQSNVSVLRERGYLVIEPDTGRMTGSDVGIGRYPEIQRIIQEISDFVEITSDYSGRRVLITAGGTREAIDPVRFIGNLSSGKQGIALAKAARNRGAKVSLIAANISRDELTDLRGIEIFEVSSTDEMKEILEREFKTSELLFMAAAVADAKPDKKNDTKIKKDELTEIVLVKNPDLLALVGAVKEANQVICGFAAETGELDLESAKNKMQKKSANFLYLNNVSGGAIFGSEETEGYILDELGEVIECVRQSKDTLSDLLLDRALDKLR